MAVRKVGILYRDDPNVNPVDITATQEEQIRKTVPQATVVRAREVPEMFAQGTDCDVLVTWAMYDLGDYLAASKHLKWIHVLSAGFDAILQVPGIQDRRPMLSSTRGIHGVPIAEHTLCMMLMFTRGFHLLRHHQQRKEWRRYLPADEMAGKTVAVLGLGEIGRVVADKCKRMGLRVLGMDVRPVQEAALDGFYSPQDLLTVLAQADYVVVTVPLTPDTRGWIGREQLRAMKRSAYLFNVARGPIIDHEALVQALKGSWIAGAGLDALDPEPLPPNSPLWEMPNVLISPHMSAISPYYMERAVVVFCENLKRFDEGRPLLFQFDWDKGF